MEYSESIVEDGQEVATMSFGKMKEIIEIVETKSIKDKYGFVSKEEVVVARVKAYKESKHANEMWANLTVFSTATVLFRFRKLPSLEVSNKMMITHQGIRYQILSVEDIREKGMYLEILAKNVEGSQNG